MLVGYSAAELLGASCASERARRGDRARRVPRRPGLVVHRFRPAPGEVTDVDGIARDHRRAHGLRPGPATRPRRGRVATDALARGRFPLGALLELVAGHRADRGLVALRDAVALADCAPAHRWRRGSGWRSTATGCRRRGCSSRSARSCSTWPTRDPAGDRVRRPGPPHCRTCSARPTPRGLPDSGLGWRHRCRNTGRPIDPYRRPVRRRLVGGTRHTATRAPARRRAPLRPVADPAHRRRPARPPPRAGPAPGPLPGSWPSTVAAGAGRRPSRNGSSARVPGAAVVHTDDIAWNHAMFDWSALITDGVLAPLRRGAGIAFRPPEWDERGRPGAVTVPAGCPLVVVEGVGIGRRDLAVFFDALVWVQADRPARLGPGPRPRRRCPRAGGVLARMGGRGAPVPRGRAAVGARGPRRRRGAGAAARPGDADRGGGAVTCDRAHSTTEGSFAGGGWAADLTISWPHWPRSLRKTSSTRSTSAVRSPAASASRQSIAASLRLRATSA